MAKRTGAVHVATTRRHYKGKEYESTLLRRSYREGGKVRNETVGNLSHLPPEVIDGIRAMLAGRTLVDLDEELAGRLTPILFTDQTPLAPSDPIAPARRSKAAKAKAGSAQTDDGYPASNLPDLLAELSTIARNEIRIGQAEHTFTRLTKPTPLQARALDLLDVKLAA